MSVETLPLLVGDFFSGKEDHVTIGKKKKVLIWAKEDPSIREENSLFFAIKLVMSMAMSLSVENNFFYYVNFNLEKQVFLTASDVVRIGESLLPVIPRSI